MKKTVNNSFCALRDKILRQIVICLIIYTAYRCMGMFNFNCIKEMKLNLDAAIMKDYSVKEIKSEVLKCAAEIADMGENFTSAVIKANEESLEVFNF